jgi:flavin-dependent dehydrogenase
MEKARDRKILVETLCEGGIRRIHQAVVCFVERELVREMERIKKKGIVKYEKQYKDLKEALDALDEYYDTIYHLMNKARLELDSSSDDEFQGNSGNQ